MQGQVDKAKGIFREVSIALSLYSYRLTMIR